MKRFLSVCMACILVLATISCSDEYADGNDGYVDLGLTSGTQWKTENEEGFITYDVAHYEFGNRLPSNDDWTKLHEECDWTFAVVNEKVTATIKGPNGNSIQLPLEGYTNCSGEFQERFWNQGRYWSSTTSSSSYGYCCMFDATGFLSMFPMEMCDGMSIRLIHKK